ncbi:MAG: alpha/beta hydrolase fold domain-containing protein [Pseudomonadota bacterium]|uniref:alpha/beta hydrolase n=1 Tax=Sphingomonas sp. ERG5 TaxID=1381597 RepID=UPI00054C2303|nr:alpha/beta hydrolase fold domain-containing protein [Sphingomonas sp. ERG5]
MVRLLSVLLVTLASVSATLAYGQDSPPAKQSGDVAVPAFTAPYSAFASDEARRLFVRDVLKPGPPIGADIAAARRHYDRINSDRVVRLRALYPVEVKEATIGGVGAQIVTPRGGPSKANAHRVLINLHGGAFLWGAGSGALVEAIPVASVSGITVITLDYRMAPEARFPAASEDVTAAYRALLKTHKPGQIGIYGCSAGGMLTAESIAWIARQGLPRPAAIGMFCAGATELLGDSSVIGPALTGQPVAGPLTMTALPYFAGAKAEDSLVVPVHDPKVLAAFPPSLLISGTRDFALSAVLKTHQELVRLGVEADLHVWDGMWHAFFSDPEPMESKEAYTVMARFFDRHLAH